MTFEIKEHSIMEQTGDTYVWVILVKLVMYQISVDKIENPCY